MEEETKTTETEEVRQGRTRGVNKILIWSITGAAGALAIAMLFFVR